MNDFRLESTANLYDPYKAARSRLVGGRRIGFFYGSHRDERLDERPGLDHVDGSDLLSLNSLGVELTPLHVPKNYFRQRVRHDLASFDVLINLVTNPDTNGVILRNIEKALTGFKGQVVNHPIKVMQSRRDIVSKKLTGLPWLDVPECVLVKATTPKAVKDAIDRAGITFPAILRVAGSHLGHCELVKNFGDIVIAKGHQYYITSFRNYVSRDGLYRKLRFWFIGDRIVFRHLLISDNWNVHSETLERYMKPRPALLDEERAMIETCARGLPPQLHSQLSTIRSRVGLDFFGIDIGYLDDGRMLLFEANASMHFNKSRFDQPWYRHAALCLPLAEAAFNSLLQRTG